MARWRAIKTSENEGWLSCKIRSERIAKEEESRVSLAPVVSKQPPDFHPHANEVTNRGIWLALAVIVARKRRGSVLLLEQSNPNSRILYEGGGGRFKFARKKAGRERRPSRLVRSHGC